MLTAAALIIGIASVIDGDTLEIHGHRIRLQGIDAPESAQVCQRDGRPWRCGQAAATALDQFINRRTVQCEQTGTDRYRRVLASCSVDGVNIETWMTENGWALDYTQYSNGALKAEERSAQGARRGIWASEFDAPWDWRRGIRKVVEARTKKP